MKDMMRTLAVLAGLALLAACAPDGPGNTLAADPVASGQGGADSLTGLGESDDPLAGESGDFGGGGDVAGSEM